MKEEKTVQENLLRAWLDMVTCIRANRIVSKMSFNEILICNILFRHQKSGDEMLTATDLCEHTKLLKSQINKILTAMEKKGLIERIRSTKDKRKMYIRLSEKELSCYLKEHQRIMNLFDQIVDTLGEEKTTELIEMMNTSVAIASQFQEEEK
ncbi:MAG: MarR family transcriptional regulator [Lachnospiraceae bacterium]|nr:MarR family transcriptional regulator [Lachnospiraceae bacterium]